MTTGILVVAWSMFAATKMFEERREHPHRDVARAWPMSKLMLFRCTAPESSQHTAEQNTWILPSAWWMCKVPVEFSASTSLEFEADGCTGMFVERWVDVQCDATNVNRRTENDTTFESTTTPEEHNLQLCARDCARRLLRLQTWLAKPARISKREMRSRTYSTSTSV